MRNITLYLLCLLMAMLMMSCSKNKIEDQPVPGAETVETNADAAQGSVAADELPEKLPVELSGTPVKAEDQNNDITFKLWALIDREGENTFFSGYSINTALAMVYNGSAGNTAKEMAAVMGYDFEPEKAHPILTKMQAKLNEMKAGEQAEVKVANAIFTAKQSQDRLLPRYLDLLRKEYLAPQHSLDFSQGRETADFINKWVEENTNKRIKDMVTAEQVESSNNGLFLANAIYFKAAWAHQFAKYSTREDTFYISSAMREEESIPIDMMQIKASFPYARLEGCQLLEMPYKDPEYAMLFVLPDEIEGFTKDLSVETLQKWQDALSRPMKVETYIPRFKMEHSLDKLAELFLSMGMRDAFHPAKADFSGIMKYSASANLYISDIAHKAFLEIKEEGTEAAAATVVGMATTSMPPPEPEMPVFRADKPFLCLILHKPDNTILFAGKVVKPEPAEK
ncbi:MAG: serpin family protein [Candidatus Cloacimonadaceae bacterium]|nr:serpin family protein [Candidatus Cloacimonadota bacterium]MCK9242933.1 serpin family protein [Candidatus Cloacimonadota bacterium]MDD3532853.1 serpin family protein [Candidatus Cloacimonadota bacterium]MDY0127926.1 serpin family protein [Candidatus Cloacimonadaceae bacterium]